MKDANHLKTAQKNPKKNIGVKCCLAGKISQNGARVRRHKYVKVEKTQIYKRRPKENNVHITVQRIRNNEGTLQKRDLYSELGKGFK